jgi:hypothetical protein
MISYGLILTTSCGLDSPGPHVASRSGGRRRARSRKLLDSAREYSWTGGEAREVEVVRRLVWLVAGAAGAAAVLVASPETYTRLRERVAGGPVGELMPGDDDYAPPPPPPPPTPPPPPPPPPPEPELEAAVPVEEDEDDTDEFTLPPPPMPDPAANELRARIGDSRARLREKAMAATPESEEDEDGDAGPGLDEDESSPGSEPERSE